MLSTPLNACDTAKVGESFLYTDIIFKRLAAVPECIVVRLGQRWWKSKDRLVTVYALIVLYELVQRTTGST